MSSSSTLSNLYSELRRYSHLQQLHSVLSKDLRATRDRVLKETTNVRRELTFFRWCMRRDINQPYPFKTNGFTKSMDYDRLLFYRKLISYLHSNPIEFGKIIVSLPKIKNKPINNSLESLYFNNETHLAECICFDIMQTDINSLVQLLRVILLQSKNTFNALSQKLFQLFIVITCHKLLNTTFRSLLNRLYKINEPLSFQKTTGNPSEILSSTLYKCCDDVLTVIISILRILPVQLRQCISVIKQKMNNSLNSSLLEWLLSTIFSPLLLQPDDWYLVICNPSKDEHTNNNNIQSIVTTLLQLCRTYQLKYETTNDKQSSTTTTSLTELLLDAHGSTLKTLLSELLNETSRDIQPSTVLVPSNATPELFIWHKIFIKLSNNNTKNKIISNNLRNLCLSTLPPKIDDRPWITIPLPTLHIKYDNNDQKDANDNSITISIGSDDFQRQPTSSYLISYIFKPIRVFLLSLTESQSRAIPIDIFTNVDQNILHEIDINLNMQQITLLHEARSRIKDNDNIYNNLNDILTNVYNEYKLKFCNNLQNALSTHNVLSSLNYIQNKESTLKELRQIAVETHENLQMRDILYLSKQNINTLRQQLNRITNTINEQQQQTQNGTTTATTTTTDIEINSSKDGSDWINDKFVIFRTSKCISKTRNALIRFLNDYGIGKVDFKRKFGGSVLDFSNKRISSILVNSIIFEIKDIFWHRCNIEDPKFKYQLVELNNKYNNLSQFMESFLDQNTNNNNNNKKKIKKIKIPSLSQTTMNMIISKFNRTDISSTVSEFELCISAVRECLIASINGADSGTGDDYMPLFCYIIMKSIPAYLPSQLQCTKVISQRKHQDKYFIDCCVAMKALRNFCNIIFKNDNDNDIKIDTIQNQKPIGTIIPIINNNEQQPQQTNKRTPQSIFNSIRSKLPQRQTNKNKNNNNNNNSDKKTNIFKLSPSNSFTSFMSNKDNNNKDNSNNNSSSNSKTLKVPDKLPPKPQKPTQPPPSKLIDDDDNDGDDDNDTENTSDIVLNNDKNINNDDDNDNGNDNDDNNDIVDNDNNNNKEEIINNDNDILVKVSTKLN